MHSKVRERPLEMIVKPRRAAPIHMEQEATKTQVLLAAGAWRISDPGNPKDHVICPDSLHDGEEFCRRRVEEADSFCAAEQARKDVPLQMEERNVLP